MDKDKLLLLLRDKKVQDYSYQIFFFLAFAFFAFFAIRPNIITAFNLDKELQELKLKNKEAENIILQIVNYQSVIETYRDKLPLLDEAIPDSPGLAKAVNDVRTTASSSGVIINSLSVESVDFTDAEGTGELLTYQLSLNVDASSEQLNYIITELLNQRRLKMFDSISITSQGNTPSVVSVEIKTYHL